MAKNSVIFVVFLFLITGCSEKVTVDYRDYQNSHYRLMGKMKSKYSSKEFDHLIDKYANEYNINAKLVKAIIKKESDFNPRALNLVSGATGLMQIKPETAGADVYRKVFKKGGRPSRNELMDPDVNIAVGVAYLTIIQEYLGQIENEESLEYCIIASFNSGAGAVLDVFSRDRKKATQIINELTPNEVYHILTTKHPRDETREYLPKVLAYKDL